MSGRTLRQIRIDAGKTLADAAAALRITVQAYWRKELGMRRLYDYEALILANLYRVPVADIISSPRGITESVTSEHQPAATQAQS